MAMPGGQTAQRTTARDAVDQWVHQLNEFFHAIMAGARAAGWDATTTAVRIREDPFGLGAPLDYEAPVLVLKRSDPATCEEQRITFEPRQRFTREAAGRIDVYSFPRLREAMLLRLPDTSGADDLTREEVEARVAVAPWKAFSPERLPLDADLEDRDRLVAFLRNLVE
jgi:hypothetical protein